MARWIDGVGFIVGCLFLLLFALPDLAAAQSCTQTLSPGANVANAVASASNGSVICLNSGNYGTVNFTNISRTGFVTVRSTTGVGATMTIGEIYGSKFIKLDSLTIANASVRGCSTNIEFWNSTFAPNTSGLVFNYDTPCSGVTDMALVVDNCVFDRVQYALFEGRLSIRGVNGLKIRNSTFSNVPANNNFASDGIQIVGGSTNVEIGPGNVFTGILQALCGSVHCDAIQDYGGGPNNTIFGNYFSNGDTFLMMPDGSRSYTIENNIFDGSTSSYASKLQFGSAATMTFRHNTLKNARAEWGSKPGTSNPASSNVLAENNIFITLGLTTTIGNACTGCTVRNNLFSASGIAAGTAQIIGMPDFVGGSSPSSLPEWQLTATSIGKSAATDGFDVGVITSTVASPPPPAPANLVVR